MSLRIVSLLPSATEILCALGLRESLVGVSHECDFPQDVVGLPIVTAPKLDPTGSSGNIHREVSNLTGQGLSVYEIDTGLLAELAPDLIVTQDQCDVCAVSYDEVVAATRETVGLDTEIVSLSPRRLRDIWQDIDRVATATKLTERGQSLVQSLRERLEVLETRTQGQGKPRVACIEWFDPLMVAGNWVPELVSIAGGSADLVEPGAHSPWLEFADLERSSPEILLAMPCGFDLERSHAEMVEKLSDPGWQQLPAARTGRVFAIDGNAYFNRPGPRLVESAEILAALIHPESCEDLLPPLSTRQVLL